MVGPQALLWNPAALAGPVGLQINGNFSPTWAMFSGPMVLNSNTVQTSNTRFLPVGGAFASYGITPQWGIGVGYYVVAGNSADYDQVQPGSLAALGHLRMRHPGREISLRRNFLSEQGMRFYPA